MGTRPTISLPRMTRRRDVVEYGVKVKEVEGHPRLNKPYTCWYKSHEDREAAYNELRRRKAPNRIFVDRVERKVTL